jgi:hypothetical protein
MYNLFRLPSEKDRISNTIDLPRRNTINKMKGEERHQMNLARREKKRKHRKDKKKLFAVNRNVIDVNPNNDEDDDAFDEDEEEEDEPQQKLPRLEDNEILFSKYFPALPHLKDLKAYTIQNLLGLKDLSEVSATEKASLLLAKLLQPVSLELFYEKHWSKLPLYIPANEEENKKSLGKLFSMKLFRQVVSGNVLTINEDIFVIDKNADDLICNDTKSSTDFMKTVSKGKALLLSHPQKYDDTLWKLFSCLEFEFNCRVDGEILVQPGQHSFTNRVMDADRFIIQLEGSTELVYSSLPATVENFLASVKSSDGNSNGDDEEEVVKIVSSQLKPLDCCYIPQGRPVQFRNNNSSEIPSLQLIISTNRKNTMADLMHLTLPVALENIKSSNSFLQLNIPSDVTNFLGVAASNEDEDDQGGNPKRKAIHLLLKESLNLLTKEIMEILDPAVDQQRKNFILERQPVPLTSEEEAISYNGFPNAVVFPYTQLRMIRPGTAVAVVEDGKVVVYHCMDNAR